MFHLALHQPQIPPNTGNLIRLAANTGVTLHLIHPLGFELLDKQLLRAGLDYHEWAEVQQHADFAAFRAALPDARIWAFTTKASRCYADAAFAQDDVLLFGSETSGLPTEIRNALPPEQLLRLPMRAGSRSLNLANSAAIAVYEAWRQLGFSS